MKHIVILFVIVSMVASCKKETVQPNHNTCKVTSPVDDLAWMKQEITNLEQDTSGLRKYFYFQQGKFLGQTVFILNNCCPMCDTFIAVLDCEGVRIENIDLPVVTDLTVIWSPTDFVCQF